MVVPAELKQQVELKLCEVIMKCEAHYNRTFAFPLIEYKKRGITAGTASYRQNLINLNAVLLVENGQTFIDRTVVHEMAHLVTRIVYPNASAHGREWKRVMGVMGVVDPTRCHSYDTSNAQVRNTRIHEYTCDCQTHKVSTKMHNQINKGKFRRCSLCNVRLIHKCSPTLVPTKSSPVATPRLGTKADRALSLYEQYNYRYSRKEMIGLFMDQLDMSLSGATTYYYNTTKKHEQLNG